VQLVYVWTVKPFKDLEFTKVELVNEATIYIVTVIQLIYFDSNQFPQDKDDLGWINIGIISLNILFNLTFVVFKSFIAIIDECDNYHREKMKKQTHK
jgi:hypothetical protein